MRVWLLKDGENLPIQENVSRMRTWMLAEELARRGHEVVWWSSTHSHQLKRRLTASDLDTVIEPGFRLILLDCGAYTRNRSLARHRHHRKLARRFLRRAEEEARPDLIVASFPIVDFAMSGLKAARGLGCPLVVDIRDPWPDVAYNLYGGMRRRLLELLLSGMDRTARRCLRGADAIVACSEGFLEWGLRKSRRNRRPSDNVYFIGRPDENNQHISSAGELSIVIPPDKHVITFLGAFGQVYELELICEAAREFFTNKETQFHFVIAGDGDKGERVRQLAADLPNVTLPGWVSASEARALLARSTLGLAPYRQLPGCMPNKIFEYLAIGLPVISSLEGDLPVLLDQFRAGSSYAPGDLEGLLGCLRQAVETDSRLASLREGAANLYRSRFVAADIYRAYASHLEQLADVA